MRILYVHGINQVAEVYGKRLASQGHSIDLYEPSLTGGSAPLPVKLALLPGRVFDLRHIVGRLDPKFFDLVHIHWASYGILGLMSRIPFVVECHGDDVRHRLRQPGFHALLTAIFQRAAAVLCITPDLLPVVRTVRPDALFLPAPINVERFAPVETISQHRSRPWTIFLFARLDPDKGSEIAVEGIARFVRHHSDVHVRLVDWGSLRQKYQSSYGNLFEFVAPVASSEVDQLIHSADVIIGQFALGALGLSELQAMSCAKPVICSFRYNEAYPEPPPLLQASTPEEVARYLECLYQHPEVGVALGQQSRAWVMANHDDRVLAGRLEELYRTII